MLLIDISLRFPSIALCSILILLLARDARRYHQAWLAVGLMVTVIASSIHTMPRELELPISVFVLALFVSVPASALQWWLARSILEDGFRAGPVDWCVMATACLFKLGWSLQGIGVVLPGHDFRFLGSYAVNFLMNLHIVWIAVMGLRHDLVEIRRRVRYWFLLLIAVIGGTNLIVELAGFSGALETIVIHATTLPMQLWAILWLSKLTPEKIFFNAKTASSVSVIDIPERMGLAYEKLTRIMETSKVYTDHDLSIGKLADQVGIPEHQLRQLINQMLGHRNFATYLNSYRLAHAKASLGDPDRAQIPILSLAMDAGYRTLSTFNRAFKASENETPSQFRKRRLREAVQKAEFERRKTEKT